MSALLLALLALCELGHARTYTVSSDSDSGPGSLRDVISICNANPDYDTVCRHRTSLRAD